MPWEANHIFVTPNPTAIKLLKSDPELAPFTYHVTDVAGFEFPDPDFRHALPKDGLIVVRLDRPGWGEAPPFWACAKDYPDVKLELEFSSERFPPPPVLRNLKRLSLSSNMAVAYYYCITHGGDVEEEWSFVFTPREILYSLKQMNGSQIDIFGEGKRVRECEDDVLIKTMEHFGLELPTGYFALHTRLFDWERYAI